MRKSCSTLALLVGLLPFGVSAPAHAMGEPALGRIDLVIPAGSLDDALKALATQSRIQILYPPQLVAARHAAGLHAKLDPLTALARLLRGSGLRAEAVNANTYLLREAQVTATRRARPQRRADAADMATVQVTGSRIPRSDIDLVTPSPLTVITRDEIEASGHQTLFELLRMQPGMQGHHPVDVASEGGEGVQQPFAAAATTSLDGLGPRATLFLIDGRRVANYGLISVDLGGLTDLDAIPLSIVERIEIMRGGASAVYGADAMAGVVNIILAKQRDGGEFVARYGMSDRGDATERRWSYSQGFETAGDGNAFIGLDYLQRDALDGSERRWRTLDQRRNGLGDWRFQLGYRDIETDRITPFCPSGVDRLGSECLFDPVRWGTLQPRSERVSSYAHWQHAIGEGLRLSADLRVGLATQELRNAPFNAQVSVPDSHPDAIPGTDLGYVFFDIGPIRSLNDSKTIDFATSLQGTAGRWDWNVAVSHDENKIRNQIDGLVRDTVATDAILSGEYRFGVWTNPPELLAAISPRVVAKGTAALDQVAADITGAWFDLPAGPARLALGGEFTRDALEHRPDPLMLSNDVALGPQKAVVDTHRYSGSLYAELTLPLTRRLQVELAARLDHRQSYGSRTSPRLGLKWQALDSLTLRGTVATGYRAPSLFELRQPTVFDPYDVVEAKPGLVPCRYPFQLPSGAEYCLVLRGALENPRLAPETSRSGTLGLVWAPFHDFSLAIDRFRIERRNEILAGNASEDPQAFPLSMQRDENGLLVGINDYFANVARTEVQGWDWDGRYQHQSERMGRWTLQASGQLLTRLVRQSRPGAQRLDHAGYLSPDRTASVSAQWTGSGWGIGLSLHYRGDARVYAPDAECPSFNAEAGRCRTPSSTTADLNLSHAGPDGWQFALNIRNLRDRDPLNYDVRKGGYDIAYDDPRGRYYLVSVTRRF